MPSQLWKGIIGSVMFAVALYFVHRSFDGMRIPAADDQLAETPAPAEIHPVAAAKIPATVLGSRRPEGRRRRWPG